MAELTPEIKKVIENTLDSGHCLASPAELEIQARAARRAFSDADSDDNGTLSHNEIGSICEHMGLPASEDDDDYFDKIDTDNSDSLSEIEFIRWWLTRVSKLPGTQSQQEVIARNTFRRFDVDGSKFLDILEFEGLVNSLGVNFTKEELGQAMQELDIDKDVDAKGNRRISEEEFLSWWMNRTAAVRRGGGLIAYKLKKLANKAARMFYTDIHTACWNGDLNLVRMFLKGEQALANAEDSTDFGQRWTPLHYAAYNGHLDVVQELLSKVNKTKVDSLTDIGFTPLYFAAQNGFIDICEKLFEAGADPSVAGFNPEYPAVHYMCPAEHMQFYPKLEQIFMKSSKCWFEPKAISLENITSCAMSLNGLLGAVIEFSGNEDRKAVSVLPIKQWCLQYTNDIGECLLANTVVPAVVSLGEDGNPDFGKSVVNFQIPREKVSLFSKFKSSKAVFMTIAAENLLGVGPPSEPRPVDLFPNHIAKAFVHVVHKPLGADVSDPDDAPDQDEDLDA